MKFGSFNQARSLARQILAKSFFEKKCAENVQSVMVYVQNILLLNLDDWFILILTNSQLTRNESNFFDLGYLDLDSELLKTISILSISQSLFRFGANFGVRAQKLFVSI